MTSTQFMALIIFILAIPQGLVSIFQLIDRAKPPKKGERAGVMTSGQVFLLLIGTAATVCLACWLIIRPQPVSAPACAPSTTVTGSATTHGGKSPAVTGSGNSFNYVGAARP